MLCSSFFFLFCALIISVFLSVFFCPSAPLSFAQIAASEEVATPLRVVQIDGLVRIFSSLLFFINIQTLKALLNLCKECTLQLVCLLICFLIEEFFMDVFLYNRQIPCIILTQSPYQPDSKALLCFEIYATMHTQLCSR